MNKRLITILAAFAALMLSGSQVYAHAADGSADATHQTDDGQAVVTTTEGPDQTATDEGAGTDANDTNASGDEDTDEDDDAQD